MGKKHYQVDDKVRLFQLYLLSVMRVSPAALSKALEQFNSTEAELAEVKRSMKGLGFEMMGGPNADFYRDLLGTPVSEAPIDNVQLPEVFRDSKALRFKLPLWPDFDFVVNELPDGGTFDPSFRRSLGGQVPPLNSLSDLQPWRFVKEEVDDRFGLPEFGDAWDSWEDVDYIIPKSAGEQPHKCSVIFDFNLLQSIRFNDVTDCLLLL